MDQHAENDDRQNHVERNTQLHDKRHPGGDAHRHEKHRVLHGEQREDLDDYLKGVFGKRLTPGPLHLQLAANKTPLLLITTNFDTLLEQAFADLAEKWGFTKPHRLVVGGKERQDSVWNGLDALDPGTEMVAIHDGARPCTAERLIADTIEAARTLGAAVAARRVSDTIKESDSGHLIARTVERARLWAVQTPQTFRVEVIRRALAAVRQGGLLVTDDAAACELIGHPVTLIEGVAPNPKVTVPADLPYVELLLRGAQRGT